MSHAPFQLHRNPFGQLVFTDADGQQHSPVQAVRAFAISAPDHGIAVVDVHGHELAWIDALTDLPAPLATLIAEELGSREFMPEIERIIGVSSFATPSTWEVDTNRGQTSFVLKGEEFIRRLARNTLLIADSHGIHYLVRDLTRLDRTSRKILDRFM